MASVLGKRFSHVIIPFTKKAYRIVCVIITAVVVITAGAL